MMLTFTHAKDVLGYAPTDLTFTEQTVKGNGVLCKNPLTVHTPTRAGD